MNETENKVKDLMNVFIDEDKPTSLSEKDKEFDKYAKSYEERFNKKA